MHYRLSLTLLMASLPFLLFFQFFLLWTCIWLQFSWETALFSCTREFKADPPKINYLILRTSIEDGSIDNESAYLNKNSKTKYPRFLHFNHLPHGVFCFVAALPYPPFSFSWGYGRFNSKVNSSKREILLNFVLLSSAQGKGWRNIFFYVLKNRCHTHCYTDSVNGFAVGDANTKIVPENVSFSRIMRKAFLLLSSRQTFLLNGG